jgi:hypothetical protein
MYSDSVISDQVKTAKTDILAAVPCSRGYGGFRWSLPSEADRLSELASQSLSIGRDALFRSFPFKRRPRNLPGRVHSQKDESTPGCGYPASVAKIYPNWATSNVQTIDLDHGACCHNPMGSILQSIHRVGRSFRVGLLSSVS